MASEENEAFSDPDLHTQIAAVVAYLEQFCKTTTESEEGILAWSADPVDDIQGEESAILSVWPREPAKFKMFDVHAFYHQTEVGLLQFAPGYEAAGLFGELLGMSNDPHLWIVARFPIVGEEARQSNEDGVGLVRQFQVYFHFRERRPVDVQATAEASLPRSAALLWNRQEVGLVESINWSRFPDFTGEVKLRALSKELIEALDWFASPGSVETVPAAEFCEGWELPLLEGRFGQLDLPTVDRTAGEITGKIEGIKHRPS